MINEPTGELIQLDFYFSRRIREEAMYAVTLCCLSNNATLSGEILAIQEGDYLARETCESSLQGQINDENITVEKIGLWNAFGIKNDCPEIITYNSISRDAEAHDTNPISIVGEGWKFSTPGYEATAKQDAVKCYRSFVHLCEELSPDFAAVLNEDSLPCGYDLNLGHGNTVFRNFFVSKSRYGLKTLARIEDLFYDAYVERLSTGIYVSTWMFSPNNLQIDPKIAGLRSKETATMLQKLR